ncbi:uncharacterized protein LOC135367137 [Ornithodoros turicata]|uniref:uncharacterized protein LOC135367137 n=1 Tax=Ornithodoros turicata TaxID=34597 RepID=UPI003138ED6E
MYWKPLATIQRRSQRSCRSDNKMTPKATLTACLALLLAAVAQCAVVSSRLENDREEKVIATDVVEDIAEEKTKEVGVLAQRTGLVLSQLGRDLEQLAQEERSEATYGFWKDLGNKIKSGVKKVLPKVLPKAKEFVIKKAAEIAQKKLREYLASQSLTEENFGDLVSSLGKSIRNLGEDLTREGVQILDGVALEKKLTEAEKKFVSTVVEAFKKE